MAPKLLKQLDAMWMKIFGFYEWM